MDSPPCAFRVAVGLLGLALAWSGVAAAPAEPDLTEIGFEALMNLEVTTVSKRPEKWAETGAAVYVITQEDIERSGVTSIPEALRLAPGVHVARINASQWSIGVRGFGSRLSRSLLVMIDGRTVYSPLFAGVYWEVQDLLLEDVERIEVIRGPGGSLWGANAVNGVVNIITKRPAATPGFLATVGGGLEEQGFTEFQYGGSRSSNLNYRAYGRLFTRDAGFHATGQDFDDWSMGRAGGQAEWKRGTRDTLRFEVEAYDGRSGERTSYSTYAPPASVTVVDDAALSGGHAMANWTHGEGEAKVSRLAFYYDRTERDEPTFSEGRDTLDLDFQQSWTVGQRQNVVWGAGYRVTADDTTGVPTVLFLPPSRTDNLASAFVQDEIGLVPQRLRLTLGSKFEHNDYSGFEVQPGVRLIWTPEAAHMLWAAVTRAVRTPSRIEHDLELTVLTDPATPTFVRVMGDGTFRSENLLAYEVGYRGEPARGVILDAAAFFNDYRDLLSIEPGTQVTESSPAPTHEVIPYFMRNGMDGQAYGFELSAERRAARWRLGASYSYLRLDLTPDPASSDTTTEAGTEGSSPRHQAQLRSAVNLPHGFAVDGVLRYVDELPSQKVDGYTELDAALHWSMHPRLRLSLVGQNLLHAEHLEYGGTSSSAVEIERTLFLKATSRW
jgi:iron complex outermembrane recepter protein